MSKDKAQTAKTNMKLKGQIDVSFMRREPTIVSVRGNFTVAQLTDIERMLKASPDANEYGDGVYTYSCHAYGNNTWMLFSEGYCTSEEYDGSFEDVFKTTYKDSKITLN